MLPEVVDLNHASWVKTDGPTICWVVSKLPEGDPKLTPWPPSGPGTEYATLPYAKAASDPEEVMACCAPQVPKLS